jgi:hypothetical protein
MNYATLSANPYIYSENEQQTFTNAPIVGDFCEITIFMWAPGTGWYNNTGIEVTVDGVNYGTVNFPPGIGNYEREETILIPSGEVLFSWKGKFETNYFGFEIYNTLGELIYTTPASLSAGLFFTYQNECPLYVECLPITDLEGAYNPDIKQVNLTWKAPGSDDLTGFDIYRNDSLIAHLSPTTVSYSDSTANLENGNYTYCVIPLYPYTCDLEDECREIPIYVGIKNYEDHIMIYPNPANDIIHIFGSEIINIKVFNNIGQLILSQSNTNRINVSELINGIYILSVETTTKQIIQKKLIINH